MKRNNISDDNFKLIDDFRMLERKWGMMESIKRINFLNYNYILYQLLRRYNRATENIKMLKSIDRTKANDAICEKLFQALGWVFSPVIKGWWVMVEDEKS